MAEPQFTQRYARDILLVEDDEDFREGLADILRSEGYSVRCAANGLEALDYLKQAAVAPNVILLDLMMPVMDGWNFRQRMLAEASLADIPVILMSALRDLPSDNSMQEAGTLHKPVELSTLLQMVEKQIQDSCAMCGVPVGEDKRPLALKGLLTGAVCGDCRGSAEALEGELVAVLERFKRRPSIPSQDLS